MRSLLAPILTHECYSQSSLDGPLLPHGGVWQELKSSWFWGPGKLAQIPASKTSPLPLPPPPCQASLVRTEADKVETAPVGHSQASGIWPHPGPASRSLPGLCLARSLYHRPGEAGCSPACGQEDGQPSVPAFLGTLMLTGTSVIPVPHDSPARSGRPRNCSPPTLSSFVRNDFHIDALIPPPPGPPLKPSSESPRLY